MICPKCGAVMEETMTGTEKLHFVLEEFPFEDDEEVIVDFWECPVCQYTEVTYDA